MAAKKKITKKKVAKKKVAKKKAARAASPAKNRGKKKPAARTKAVKSAVEDTPHTLDREKAAVPDGIGTEPGKGSGGRPSLFTQEIADEILERIIEGESLRAICKDEHLPNIVTVVRWVSAGYKDDAQEHLKEFCKQYAHARELQSEVQFEEALDEAREAVRLVAIEADDSRKGSAVVQAQKLVVDTIKWRTGKMSPKKYGELVKLEHSGKVDSETTLIIKDFTGDEAESEDDDG